METVSLFLFPPEPLSFNLASHRRSLQFPVWPRFRKSQGTAYQGCQLMIHHLHSNVQHIRKQIWRKYARTYQTILFQTRSIPCISVDLSAKGKGIHVCRALLQHSCNEYFPFSFIPVTLFSNHIFTDVGV